MGILMMVGIGVLTAVATGSGVFVYREGKRSLDKVDRLIKEVDEKKEKIKPEDKIKEILDNVNGDRIDARWILKDADPKVRILKEENKDKICSEPTVHEDNYDDVAKAIEEMDIDDDDTL
jgi:hypothetical protein